MGCSTGKRMFLSEGLAEEALIQNHIRNDYRPGEGPTNIYECAICGAWHFTSKNAIHPLLEDPDVIKRIETERRAYLWEQRLK